MSEFTVPLIWSGPRGLAAEERDISALRGIVVEASDEHAAVRTVERVFAHWNVNYARVAGPGEERS